MLSALGAGRVAVAMLVAGGLLLGCTADGHERATVPGDGAATAGEGAGADPPTGGDDGVTTSGAAPSLDPPMAATNDDEPVPPIRDDDPLFLALPSLEPRHEDLTDEDEAAVLDLVARALETEAQFFATGEVDHDRLRRTHDGPAYDRVLARVEVLGERGLMDRRPDLEYTSIEVTQTAGPFVVMVRTCARPGPRSGLYDRQSRELVDAIPPGTFADQRQIELRPDTHVLGPALHIEEIGSILPSGCP